MSRRRKVYKKEEKLDSRYGSPAVARLISTVMKRGKKSLAERIVYTAIDKSREGSDAVDPLEIVNKALENVRPRLEVKSRRVGGATYQVPMEVTPARQVSLAMRWIVQYADGRRGMTMANALAAELKDAASGQGNAIKNRDDTVAVPPGGSGQLTVTLAPGTYTLYCSLPDHEAAGMRTTLTVK